MKKTEIYFDSRDGENQIHALRYEPDEDKSVHGGPVAVLQIVHGMAEYVERYEETAKFFTDRGFVVTGDDHLGHGKTVTENGVYGYFCRQDPATVVVRDVHRLKKMTQALYPGVPYFILGHSMGSFILRNYICRYGSGIQGAVIMGTGTSSSVLIGVGKILTATQKLLWGGKHVSRMLDRLAFGSYNKQFENPRTPNAWLSRDEGNTYRYDADPLCGFTFTVNGFQTVFELISRAQKKENLLKIPRELPIFLMAGAEDPVGNYGEGVRQVYQSLKEVGLEHMEIKLYEKDRHEILNEADRDVVMQDIYDWIVSTLSGAVS